MSVKHIRHPPDFDGVLGHEAPITTVDLCPDESIIATGSYDGRICLWSGDGACRCVFRAPHLVNLVRFNRDGTELACAAADNKAYVLDVDSGSLLAVAGPFGDDVNAAMWRPGRREIAIVADTFDPVVRLWDLERGRETAKFTGHTDCVCGVAFDNDGLRMATAGEDGTARIWELGEDRCVAVLEHPSDPESIDWSPDSRFIVTGCNDGVLRLYDGSDYSLICTNDTADAAVRFVRFAPDGRSVLAGSYDAHVRCLSVPGLEVQATLKSPWQWERSVAAGRSKIVVGSFGSEPVVYDNTGKVVGDGGRTYGINALDADIEDGELRVFVGRDDGAIVDAPGSAVLARHDSIVNGVALSPGGTLLASCDYRGNVHAMTLDGTVMTRLHPGGTGPLNTIVWLGEDHLLTAGYSGELVLCALASGEITRTPAHAGPIKALCVDEATGMVVAGSSDHSVSVWSGFTKVGAGSDDDLVLVNGTAILESGKTFVSCSRDGLVRVWSLQAVEVVERLPRAHFRSVKSIATGGAGSRVLTGSYDGRGVLWTRGEGGWSWRYLDAHGLPGVPAVKIVGETIVTGGWDGNVALWDLDGHLEARMDVAEAAQR